uniref:Uncharacterized protein n=1 Tax=viral metagenome TaxID=1070528 RepID=A0A6C0HY43_9ZZZZ
MLAETILLPMKCPDPNVIFFKRVTSIPENTKIKIYYNERVIQVTAFESTVQPTYIQCVTKLPDRTAPHILDSRKDIIMEADPIDVELEVNERLLLKHRDNLSVFMKIPSRLWKDETFRNKLRPEHEKAQALMNQVHRRSAFEHSDLPEDISHHVNAFLGVTPKTPKTLKPCKTGCSISGGRKHTRKNKKKRYGRL